MFAIIQTSGRQFRVEPGAVIAIDGHNAGEAGGEVIASGTPEQIAEHDESYTGQFLRAVLAEPAAAAA